MLFVLLSWVALFGLVAGIGGLVAAGLRRLTRGAVAGDLDTFQVFWLGLAALIAVVQLWSLVAPLGIVSLGVAFAVSLAGVPALGRVLRADARAVRDAGPAARRWAALLAVAGLAAVAVGAARVATTAWFGMYDSDLYHFSAVRWANTYPAVPGLANLHSRLGMNSGYLLFAALVDNAWWDRASAWLVGGFLLSVACLHWLWIVLGVDSGRPHRARLFALLTLPYPLGLTASNVPSLYFDKPALLLQLLLMAELLRHPAWRADPAPARRPSGLSTLVVVLALAALGFSFKLVGVVTLALCAGGALVALARGARAGAGPGAASAAARAASVFGLPALIVAGHFARNAVLSGWLLYPAPAGRLPVDWAVPADPLGPTYAHQMQSVRGQNAIIRGWARVPGPDHLRAANEGFVFWFPRWRAWAWRGIEPRLLFGGIALLLGHVLLTAFGPGRRRLPADLALAGLAAANLLFWFLSAPDLRFGDGFFWLWLGVTGALFLSWERVRPPLAAAVAALVGVVLLCRTAAAPWPGYPVTLWQVGAAAPLATAAHTIDNGQVPPLVVHVPVRGDQCGDAELPCTPYPRRELRMREPGNLRAGFRVDPAGP